MDVTLKTSVDTYDAESAPRANYGDNEFLKLNAAGGGDEKDAFLFFHRPFKLGDNVIFATLTVYLKGAWTGPTDIRVDRVNEKWREDTLNWNNAPTDIDATSRATETVTGGANGDAVEIDVTAILADVSGGDNWFGFFLTIDAGGDLSLHSSETTARHRRPTLEVKFSTKPDVPTDLSPNGHTIGRAKPRLNWSFQDRSGQSAQKKLQVQISDDPNDFSTPVFDSTWLTTSKTQLDLNTTAYGGVGEGSTRYWRVRVQDDDGNISDWSDVASMMKIAKGDVTISTPADGGNVETHTPTVTHSLSVGTQEATEYVLKEWDGPSHEFKQIYHRGKKTTTDVDFEIPKGYIRREDTVDGHTHPYRIIVRVWDDEDREHTANDLAYSEDKNDFRFHRPAGDIVDLLDAAQLSDNPKSPVVRLQFHRTATPEYFALRIERPGLDPEFAVHRIDPADLVNPAGATYNFEYDYYEAIPSEWTIYHMCPVVLDGGVLKVITGNDEATLKTDVWGVWIVRPSTGEQLFIAGRNAISSAIGEASSTFTPLNRRSPVLITDSIRGFEGSVSGLLIDWAGTTAKEYVAMLESFKGLAGSDELRLVTPNRNFPIQLPAGTSIAPASGTPGNIYEVVVPYAQTGGFTFKTHVEA